MSGFINTLGAPYYSHLTHFLTYHVLTNVLSVDKLFLKIVYMAHCGANEMGDTLQVL